MTFSGLVVVFTLFLPEVSLAFSSSSKIALLTSIQIPRWLMANDSTEEALDVMVKYHGEGDRKSPIVQLEYEEMRSARKTFLLFRMMVDTLQLTSPRQVPTSVGGITANYSTLEKFGTEQCSWYSWYSIIRPLLHVFTNKFFPRLSSANGQEMAL